MSIGRAVSGHWKFLGGGRKVIPLKTTPGQADGIAEATNHAGLTVGYLGNQSKTEPEMDQFAVWRTRAAAPQLMGPSRANLIAEFADVNDRGQAVGMTGTMNPKTGFHPARAVIWRTGWPTRTTPASSTAT